MAGKTLTAMISLAGKVDGSLSKAIQTAQKQVSGLGAKLSSIAGSKGVQAIASGAKTAAKAMGAVALAGGAAAVAVGKQALDSYAQYEQLAGGVEALFGDAAGTVKANAASAFNQAGVSANQYMEQATAFSASLIQTLGGDTQKAAGYADTAIKDMSDNANRMGTDIESIQQTYQSLMRGNYAMLDNLKLGRPTATIAEYKPRENGGTLLLAA